jgi:hypothetical protein
MKYSAVALALMLSFISLAHAQQPTDSQPVLIDRMYQRCSWACTLLGLKDSKDAASERIIALKYSHTVELAALAEYWESRATRELTPTLEFLSSVAKRDGINLASTVESQYRVFYFENLNKIESMLEEVAKLPKSGK